MSGFLLIELALIGWIIYRIIWFFGDDA